MIPRISITQDTGETPLHLAVKENKLVIVERLLELGANVNQPAQVCFIDRMNTRTRIL